MNLPEGFVKAIIKSENPLVSVVIPAYNEEKDIEECIQSLKKQTYKNKEIIIVDDGSTDKTIEIIKKHRGIKLLRQQHGGPGQARNLGAKRAKGEILILIDADMVLFPDYIEKLIEPLLRNEALGTIESIQYNVQKTKMQECWGTEVKTNQLEGEHSGTVRAIARNDFLQLGGFDRKYGYADDRTFYLKYGIKFLIVKDVKCYHKTPPTFNGVYKQSRWIGSSLEGPLKYRPIAMIAPFVLYLLFPFAIPVLAIKKCYENKDFKIFPWMLMFMVARYTGTISGIFKKAYFGDNTR